MKLRKVFVFEPGDAAAPFGGSYDRRCPRKPEQRESEYAEVLTTSYSLLRMVTIAGQK